MYFIKKSSLNTIIIAILFCTNINYAYSNDLFSRACVLSNRIVPFQDILLNPNCNFQANYAFNNNPIIFCFLNTTDNVNIGRITWTFKGKQKSGVLPIFLTNNTDFQGELADNSGTISIRNNFNSPFVVSCLYGF